MTEKKSNIVSIVKDDTQSTTENIKKMVGEVMDDVDNLSHVVMVCMTKDGQSFVAFTETSDPVLTYMEKVMSLTVNKVVSQ